MDDFQTDQEEWYRDWRHEHFDYPKYLDYQPDPSNFDLDIPH